MVYAVCVVWPFSLDGSAGLTIAVAAGLVVFSVSLVLALRKAE